MVVVTSSLVATSLIVICTGQPPGIGGLTRTHTHKYPYPHTHGYPLSRVPSMGVRVYPLSLSSCRRALLCRRCHDAVALAICITAASSCRPSSVNIVHRRVVRRASSSSSSCRRGRRRRDAVALAICVTAVSSCRPSSVNVVHCVLLHVMRRVSACRHRHVVRGRVVRRHCRVWTCRRRVVRRRDAVAMTICIASLSSCRRVVRAYRPSWVIVVVTPWQCASASRRRRGSPCRGSDVVGRRRRYAVRCGSPWVVGVSVQVQRTQERLTSRLPPLVSLMPHQRHKWWWDRRHRWGCWGWPLSVVR